MGMTGFDREISRAESKDKQPRNGLALERFVATESVKIDVRFFGSGFDSRHLHHIKTNMKKNNTVLALACFFCAMFFFSFFVFDGINLLTIKTNLTIEMVSQGLRPWELSTSTVRAVGVFYWLFWLCVSALMVHIGGSYWDEKNQNIVTISGRG